MSVLQKKTKRCPKVTKPKCLAYVLVAFLSFLPTSLLAHGTGWQQVPNDKAVVIEFYYSDNTFMSYSDVRIFSPENPDIEYQKAKTDRNGVFAFQPNVPGVWKFETSDGQGHLAAGQIEIAAPTVPSPEATGTTVSSDAAPLNPPPAQTPLARSGDGTSKVIKYILGLSIILNLALILFIAGKLKRKEPKVS